MIAVLSRKAEDEREEEIDSVPMDEDVADFVDDQKRWLRENRERVIEPVLACVPDPCLTHYLFVLEPFHALATRFSWATAISCDAGRRASSWQVSWFRQGRDLHTSLEPWNTMIPE